MNNVRFSTLAKSVKIVGLAQGGGASFPKVPNTQGGVTKAVFYSLGMS